MIHSLKFCNTRWVPETAYILIPSPFLGAPLTSILDYTYLYEGFKL